MNVKTNSSPSAIGFIGHLKTLKSFKGTGLLMRRRRALWAIIQWGMVLIWRQMGQVMSNIC